jgi:hypothetical protein
MTVTPHCLHFTNSRESRLTCMHGHSLTSFMAPPEQRMNQVWKQLRAKWQWPLECVSVFLHASTSGARIWRGSQRSYTLAMGEHYGFNYYVWDDMFFIMLAQCIVYSYCVFHVDKYGCGAADRSNPSSAIQRMVCLETQLFRYVELPGLNRPVPKVHNLTLSQARHTPFKLTRVTCTGSFLILPSGLRQDFLNGYLCLSFGTKV